MRKVSKKFGSVFLVLIVVFSVLASGFSMPAFAYAAGEDIYPFVAAGDPLGAEEAAEGTPPTIDGPMTCTLEEGYALTSVGPYTVTGNPAPTVTIISHRTGDNPYSQIQWNPATQTVDISPGLAVGQYDMHLLVINGYEEYYDGRDLLITVTERQEVGIPPAIDGPTHYFLDEGYALTSIAYTVTGYPTPTVTLIRNPYSQIQWNPATQTLDVSPGLTPGQYEVTFFAENRFEDSENGYHASVLFGPVTVVVRSYDPPTITYHPNGGVGSPYSVLAVRDSDNDKTSTYNVGVETIPPEEIVIYSHPYYHIVLDVSVPAFSYAGHPFVKWNTQADGSGTSYAPGDKMYPKTDTVDLYAIWEETSTPAPLYPLAAPSSFSDSSEETTPETPPLDHFGITKYMAEATIRTAMNTANRNGSALVKTRLTYPEGHILIRPKLLDLMDGYEYIHDTTEGPVQVRVRIPDPAKVNSTVYLCGSVTGREVDKVIYRFEKWFPNDIRVVDLHQSDPWGQTVKLAALVDFTGMNTQNLYFYSYNKETNKFTKIKTTYQFDSKGYIHFSSALAGAIVIADGSLSDETQGELKNPTTGGDDIPDMQNPSANADGSEIYNPSTGGPQTPVSLMNTTPSDQIHLLTVVWVSAVMLIVALLLWAFIPRKNDEYIALKDYRKR
jgi:hypothetical protein